MVSTMPAEVALARLRPDERRWVEEFRDRLRTAAGPRLRDLRIYGSKVRGDAHPESDIDLLVLVESCTYEECESIWSIAQSISPWLSPNVFDFEEYHSPMFRASGFYKEMRTESVRL